MVHRLSFNWLNLLKWAAIRTAGRKKLGGDGALREPYLQKVIDAVVIHEYLSNYFQSTMASRKRNDFLDIEESDDDKSDYGYDSEAAEESKTRSTKRRKILDTDSRFPVDIEDEDEDDEQANGQGYDESDNYESPAHRGRSDDEPESNDEEAGPGSEKSEKKKIVKPHSKPPKKNKTGVVYFSSLPPYLKPMSLKTLLLQRGFGPITRVFLTPSVRSTSGSGRRNNKRKTYSDGWVEFESKKTAKIAAEALNANIVGGPKVCFT